MIAALLLPLGGWTQTQQPTQNQPPQAQASGDAGKITALIPVDSVIRQRKPITAVKGMGVIWGDTVQTAKAGRVRVQLADGSVLNVGSQSSLVIQRHNPTTQQTDLDLIYGRVRSDVQKIVAPNGGFNVRTNAAVAGVIGTLMYVEAAPVYTTVIAMGGGDVSTRSTDARFPTVIILHPGEAVSFVPGRAASPKRQATSEELQKAFQETEANPTATPSPQQVASGQTTSVSLSGTGLSSTTGVSASNPGIKVQISGPVTATEVPLTVTVAADVPPGTYPLTLTRPAGQITSQLIVVSAAQASLTPTGGGVMGPLTPPTSQTYTVSQGSTVSLDASSATTPSGTQIVAYQWTILTSAGQVIPGAVTGNQSTFQVDTTLLPGPGNYTVQLVLVNSNGQTATQQFPITVNGVLQPADIIAQLAGAYETLQPSQFLVNFDQQRFPNYAGFAQAVQNSFLNSLQSVRVFQRPVNCATTLHQAVCQADFQVQFTLKSEPTVPVNSNGNQVPAGTPGSTLGKPIESGNEQATISFYLGDAGWKITGYTAQVSCPGGNSTNGVNVGSCIIAIGSTSSPSFQLTNLQLSATTLPVGGSVTGTFQVVPAGGFNGSVTFTGVGQFGNQSVAVSFFPPSASSGTVNFTVTAPTTPPTGFTGSQAFTLVITGMSGTLTGSVSQQLTLTGGLQLSVSPGATSGNPAQVLAGSTLNLTVSVTSSGGISGNTVVSLLNPPPGFVAEPTTIATGSSGTLSVFVPGTATPGALQLTVQGVLGSVTTTTPAFLNIVRAFTLNVTPVSSTNSPIQVTQGGSFTLSVQVVAGPGFTGSASIVFSQLPTGFTATGGTVQAGATGSFPVQVGSTANLGPQQFTVAGTLNDSTVSTSTVFVNVTGGPSFALQVAPATTASSPVQAIPSGALNITVQVIPINGFSGSVTVSLQSITGFSANPITVSPGTPGTMQVQIASTTSLTPSGSPDQLVLQGVAGAASQTASVFVAVIAPFSLNVTPVSTSSSPVQVTQGSAFNFSVQVVPALGFSGTAIIGLSTSNANVFQLPSGGSIAAGSTASFQGSINSTAPLGPAQFTVQGTLGETLIFASTTVFVNVNAPSLAQFFLQQSTSAAAPLVLAAGSSAILPISVVAANSTFTSPVTLTFGVLPTGLAQPSPVTATVLPGGSQNFVLTFNPPGNASNVFGFAQVTVTGAAAGAPSAITTVVLNLVPAASGPFTLNSTSPPNSPLVFNLPSATQGSFQVFAVPSTFSQPITLSFASVPTGVSINPSTVTFTPSVSGELAPSFAVTVNPGVAVPGTYMLLVSGSSGGAAATAAVGLQIQGSFSLSASPNTSQNAPLVLAPNGTAQAVTVTVASVDGFSGPVTVNFSAPFSIPGLSVQPSSSQTVNVSAAGQAQVTFNLSVPSGTKTTAAALATITGSSPNGPQVNAVTGPYISVGPSDFSVSLSPNQLILQAGGAVNQFNVLAQVTPIAGFAGAVNLTVNPSSVPSGLEVQPQQITVQAGGQGQFFFHAHGSATPGNFPNVEIDGSVTGGATHQAFINVTIQGQITLNVTTQGGAVPGTQTIGLQLAPNSSLSFTVQVGSVNNYAGPALLQLSSPPDPNVTFKFASSGGPSTTLNLTANQTATDTLTISANSAGLAFNFEQINVQASGSTGLSSTSPIQTIFLASSTAAFVLGCDLGNTVASNCSSSPLTLGINQSGSTGTLQLRADSSANLRDPVKVVPVNLPAGVTMTPNPVTLTPQNALAGTDVPVTFSAGSGAAAGTFTFTLQGTDTVNTAISSSTSVQLRLLGSLQLSVTSPVTSASSPVMVAAGASQAFTLNVTGQNGFSGTATIFATLVNASFPANVCAGAGPPPCSAQAQVTVPASGSVSTTFTVFVPAGTPSSAPVQVVFDSQLTPNTYIVPGQSAASGFFAAGTGSFAIQMNPTTTLGSPLLVGSSPTDFNLTILPLGGFNGIVTVGVSGLPSGVSILTVTPQQTQKAQKAKIATGQATADFPTFGAPVNVLFQFIATSAAVPGYVQATLTASSGSISQSCPLVLFVTPSLQINVTPATQAGPLTIAPGGSSPITVSVSSPQSFTGAVSLTFPGLPPQLSINPGSAQLAVGSSPTTFTISASSSATAGTQLFVFIAATINNAPIAFAQVNVVIGSAAFNLSVSPASAVFPNASPPVLTPGGSPTNLGITVNSAGGFSSPVTVSLAFVEANASTPNPITTVNPGQTATFPISAVAGAAGTQTILVLATAGNQVVSLPLLFSVGSGGFGLLPLSFFSPSSGFPITAATPLVLNANGSAQMNVVIESEVNFTGAVTLVPSGLPAGVTISPANATLTNRVQNFLLTANSGAAAGTTQFTVTGTSGTLAPVVITIPLQIVGTYTLSLSTGGSSTAPLAIAPGTSQNFQVNVTAVTNFGSQQVTVFPNSSLPAGISISPLSATATPTQPAAFTLTAASTAQPAGEQTISIFSFSTAGATQNTTLFYTVASSASFNLSSTPSSGSPLNVLIGDPGGGSAQITLIPIGGFTGNVTVAVTGLPSGVTANPATSTVSLAGTPVTVPISFKADSTVQPGSVSVTVTATVGSGGLAKRTLLAGSSSQQLQLQLNLLGNFQLQFQATNANGSQIQGGNCLTTNNFCTIAPGNFGSVNIFVTALNNFGNNPVSLSASGSLPSGVSVSVSPTASANTPGLLNVTVASNAQTSAVFPVTVTAQSSLAFNGSQAQTLFFAVANGTLTISLTPPSTPVPVAIGGGQFVNFTVVLSGVGQLKSPANLSVQTVAGSVPTGVTVSPSIGTATINGTISNIPITFQVMADSTASAGLTSFQMQATLGTSPPATTTATVPLDLQGSYSLTVTPVNSAAQPAVVSPGQSVTLTVSVTGQNHFQGTVNLSSAGAFLPPGVTVTSSPASPSSPGQIIISAAAGTPATAEQPIVFLTSASDVVANPPLTICFAVGPPGISISSFASSGFDTPQNPAPVMISGTSQIVFVQAVSLGGFTGPATITVGTLPAGLTVSPTTAQGTIQANSGAATGGIPFAFQASAQATQGPVSVPLTVTSGSITVTGFIYLLVSPNLALVQNPATSSASPLLLSPGNTTGQTFTVTLQNQGGFTGTIPLTLSTLPTGITVTSTPNPPVAAAGGSVSFTVTAASNAPGGLQSFTISATFAGLTASTQVFFFVGSGDFALSISPASTATDPIAVQPGTSGAAVLVTAQPQNGFGGSVIVQANPPTGVTAVVSGTSSSSTTLAAGQTATFVFSAASSLGTTPVQATFTGTSGTLSHISSPVFLLVNSPGFTVGSLPSFTLEQGNLAGVNGNATVQNSSSTAITLTLSFSNLPTGVHAVPATETITVPGNGTAQAPIGLFADASTVAPSQFVADLVATTATQTQSFPVSVSVTPQSPGIFLTTNPPTSIVAPLLLQPDSTLVSFVNINVNSLDGFAGTANLTLSGVPAGVSAVLVPASVSVPASGMQTVQLQLQTSPGLAPFAPTAIVVTAAAAGAPNATTSVYVTLQTASTVAKRFTNAPQVQSFAPSAGVPGSYTLVTVSGRFLSNITSVLADSPHISGTLQAARSDQQLQINIFLAPAARAGMHTLLLVGPNGSLPVAFAVNGPAGDDGETGVHSVTPSKIQAGTMIDAKFLGTNLSRVTAVRVDGSGINAQVIATKDSELHVRFTVDPSATPGSRVVTIEAGDQAVAALVEVTGSVSSDRAPVKTPVKTNDEAPTDRAPVNLVAATPALRVGGMTMTPEHPKHGDTITFEARLTNDGAQPLRNVPVEFSMPGTHARGRQTITLNPGENQTIAFDWQALRSGRFEAQLAIDPEKTIAGLDHSQTSAKFPAFELADAPSLPEQPAMRQRTELSVTLGGCIGLRLSSGNETTCGAGDADVRLSSRAALSVEAEGVRNLGAVPLDQVASSPTAALGRSESLTAGSTYIIQAGRQAFAVRILRIRGLESARNAPPAALRSPKLGGLGRTPRAEQELGTVTLSLEWRELVPQQ